EDGIRDGHVTGVQTCALPILLFFFRFFLFGFLLGGFLPDGHGSIGLFVFRFLLRGFFKFLDERFLFLFAPGAFGDVALTVEENEIGRASCRERVEITVCR